MDLDLKFALRSLRRSPGFSTVAVLILALGIGVNAAIFSVVYAVVLRPLNYPHPEQLLAVTMAWPNGSGYSQISGPDYVDLRAGTTAILQTMAAYNDQVLSIAANNRSEFTGVAAVSEDFLPTLAVKPIAGRAFKIPDFNGHPSVALVSRGFWTRHFSDVPFSTGHYLKGAGIQLEIVGLLPSGFHFPESSTTEVWTPLFELPQDTDRSAHNYQIVGRLRPGVTVPQAQARLSAIAAHLAQTYPNSNKNGGVRVTSLANFTVRSVKTTLYILLLAVALVLMIACANIANLLMVRGSGRIRELAIRLALGAGRVRLMRQLLTETLILAFAGAAGGIVLADAFLPLLLRLAPASVPRLDDIQMDWRVLCLCAAIGFASILLFGLAPALQASRVEPNQEIRGAGSRGVIGGGARALRHIFVTAEVALCLVLLVSAGLMLRSFVALTSVDLGFRTDNVLAGTISVPEGTPENAAQRVFSPLLERAGQNPRVVDAALTASLPADRFHPDVGYLVSGQAATEFRNGMPEAEVSIVSGSYFKTLGIPLVAGRVFGASDNAAAPLTVIVNRAFVRQSFPHQNPIGLKIMCGADMVTMKWASIVGIVADAHLDNPKDPAMPELYYPYLQHPRPDMNILVKTRTDAIAFAQPLRAITETLDPEASLKLTTLESHMSASIAAPRFSSALISAFAGLAVLLAAIGIYGVIAYSVTRRTNELGLRMALGADRWNVVTMVLKEALQLIGLGLAIGIAGSIAAARLLRAQLFQTSPAEPSIYAGMIFILIVVALAAAFLPAWRASRVEPLTALRQE